MSQYVELCARSNFSFLQGASHPDEMVDQAVRLGYSGLALCDLNGLYGVARGYQAAKSPSLFQASPEPQKTFHYLIGTELTLDDGSSLTLVPMNKTGYHHLCRLLTLGKREVEKGFSKISLKQVAEWSGDLLAWGNPQQFFQLREIFADRLYIPVYRDLTWESMERWDQCLALESKEDAQLFVTQRPLMHSRDRKPLFDVLTCLLHHTTIDQAAQILAQNAERYLHPISDLCYLWKDRLDLLAVTVEIAKRVEFSLDQIRYRYPASQLPAGLNSSQYLQSLTEQGLHWRYPQGVPDKVQRMCEHELKLISELEYEDYFLTLYEICQFAREQGILYQGRGSAANSVVCFAIGLTAVDPTQIDLLFERFISKERDEPPDIDIDFEHSRREEVIQYIYRKYDESHAAMVCTIIRFKSRLALRETCKVFGVELATINKMIKYMGRDGIRRLIEDTAAHKNFGISDHRWKLILALTQEIYGFPRHLGIHTGGFLITHDPITEIVPVEKATMNGRYVIQWNKDDVNFLKLMKIDVLSLGMLTALRKCLVLLKNHKGIDWNLAQIPAADEKTYTMISQADTVGVFQIESRAQMNTLPRLRPQNFYDLVVEVALIRPGPLQGGMVHPYLKRRQGLEKVTYAHPDLELVLKKTLGVPIFQEQVMKIAVVAAGFTPGEADELRRVMSMAWRKKGTMESIRNRIMQGLHERGIRKDYAEQIYKTIEGFANYGFPESHAASFALLTYASCYLKCHHPDVFTCALLNSQPMGFYSPRVLIADAQRHGVRILPLDLQCSQFDYSLERPELRADSKGVPELFAIRSGFCCLYGASEEALKNLVLERDQNGAFVDLADLVRRTRLPRALLVKLAAAGALRGFSDRPRDLIWKIESLSLDEKSFLWGSGRENVSGQVSGEDSEQLPFESNWEVMYREYAHKGFSIDLHPISILRTWLEQQNEFLRLKKYVPYYHAEDLKKIPHRTKVRVAGLINVTQRPPTAKGMCFITLEDEFGFMNIIVPPTVYQKDRLTIYEKSLLEIHGTVEKKGAVINIRAERVLPLNEQFVHHREQTLT